MKVQSTSGATGWWLIGELATRAAIVNIVFMVLLFETSMGDRMPDWFKVLAPIFVWVVTVGFFIMHRTPDKKGVEYKIW